MVGMLRGVGADGIPFTNGDIVPQIPVKAGEKSGLLTERATAHRPAVTR